MSATALEVEVITTRTHKFRDLEAKLRERHPELAETQPERLEQLRVYGAAYQQTLAEIRRAREKTQTEVAAALGVEQSQISRLEKRTDLYLSTLERYVVALGGHLELTAVFGEERFPIQLSDLAGEETAPQSAPPEPEPSLR